MVLAFVFATSNEKWFCEIVDDPCWFLEEFWWVLISFPLVSKDLENFVGFLGAAGPPPPMVLLACVFPVFCKGFKGGQSEIEVKPK